MEGREGVGGVLGLDGWGGMKRGRKCGERRILHGTSSNVAEGRERSGRHGGEREVVLKSDRTEDFKWRGG